MIRYILNRLWQAVIVLVLLSLVVFLMSRLGGDPAILYVSDYGTEADRLLIEEELGLNKPIYEQYASFLFGILKGDLGKSFKSKKPVLDIIVERIPATAKLVLAVLLLTVVLGFIVGILAAVKRGSLIDSAVRIFALFGQSAPTFVVGLLLMFFIAVKLRLLPTSGYGGIKHLILPATALSWFSVATIARLLRGSMLDVLGKDYIKLARIKGLPEKVVILKHVLKNSIIPVITYIGPFSVMLVTGTLAVEVVFGWPGIGQLAYQATTGRDFPIVQATVLILSSGLIFVNLLVDILYAWIDPRVRLWK